MENKNMDHFHNAEAIIENYCHCTADKFLVWSCKTLGNWKAIYAVPDDGMFYEITFSGDTQQYYFDAYKKVFNRAVRTDDIPKMAYQREIPADVPDCVKDFQRDCFWYEDDEQDFWVFLLELMNQFPLNRYIYHPEKTMEEFDRRYEHLLSSMDEVRDELKKVFAEREKKTHNA